jgi:hypothetical protein
MVMRCEHSPSLKTKKDCYPNCAKCGVPITQIPGWFTPLEKEKMLHALEARMIVSLSDIDKDTGNLTSK